METPGIPKLCPWGVMVHPLQVLTKPGKNCCQTTSIKSGRSSSPIYSCIIEMGWRRNISISKAAAALLTMLWSAGDCGSWSSVTNLCRLKGKSSSEGFRLRISTSPYDSREERETLLAAWSPDVPMLGGPGAGIFTCGRCLPPPSKLIIILEG